MTPLLAEPRCYTVSYRFVSDHLYLGCLPAGLGVRSSLPGAACSMSQEPYDLTQQVSQPTAVPKNNFDPGEKR